MYLQGFVDPTLAPSKNVVWVYEHGARIRKASPRKVARDTFFYSIPPDEAPTPEAANPHWIERTIGLLESHTASTLEKLRLGNIELTEQEKGEFAGFMALTMCRTPFFLQSVERVVIANALQNASELVDDADELAARLRRLGTQGKGLEVETVQDAFRALLSGRVKMQLAGKAWSMKAIFQAVNPRMDLFASLRWVLLDAPPGHTFLTSDNPVIVQDPGAMHRDPPGSGWTIAVQFFFPVSRDKLLMGRVDSGPDERGVIQLPSFHAITSLSLDRAHRQVFASYRSETLQGSVDWAHSRRNPTF